MLVKIIPEFSNNICNYPYLTVTSYGHLCQTQSKSCKSHSASPQALLGFPQPREHQPGWGKEAAAFAQLSFLLEKPTNQPKWTNKQTTKLEKRDEGTNKRDPIYHRNIFVNNKIIYIKHIIFSSLQNSLRTRYFARKTVGILNTFFFWLHSEVALASYTIAYLLKHTGMDKSVWGLTVQVWQTQEVFPLQHDILISINFHLL